LVVHEHERDVRVAYLLEVLIVIVGSAAILIDYRRRGVVGFGY
jgi:hypothetical protein